MKINLGTFAKPVDISGQNPNWATPLGQNLQHKINDFEDIDEILKGMIYKSVPISTISVKLGKGGRVCNGNDAEDSKNFILSALFSKVYVNDKYINDGKFILLIIKQLSGEHTDRLILKYAKSATYDDGHSVYSNEDFFDLMESEFGINQNDYWLVSDISITNQDELRLKLQIAENVIPDIHNSTDLKALWEQMEPDSSDSADVKTGENIIFYGIPGCGKSDYIKKNYCNDERYMERIVFHPDYTYSDFVGQILPDTDSEGHISYKFKEGPFTRVLKAACDYRYHNYYLVIEELNRGNAPAIMGDIFQLLDRKNGVSEYSINNADIAEFVYKDAEHPVRIPENLFILATMNTSDQNVFTLDTAFKRRWKMENIKCKSENCDFAKEKICDFNVTWEQFLDTINSLIVASEENSIGNEDKRLGAYFIKKDDLKDRKTFSEKVIMYLWNDAFKYKHDECFKTEYKTLEEVLAAFQENGFVVFNEKVKFGTNN